ncbi:hypothetical protein TNCV_1862031 [Trichonephila clavipes]|nr:hypothetical protein TNCV_1862031 [Trichonephila clavipes]
MSDFSDSMDFSPSTSPSSCLRKAQRYFHREQIKFLYEKFPNIRNKTSGDVIKIYTNDFEEYRSLIQAMVADKEFELYVINPKLDKPIKVVIKGLPISSKIEDIKNDLEEEGYVIESCTQLISKRTTNPLPFFQPKKSTPFADPMRNKNFASNRDREETSLVNIVSGETPNQTIINNKKEKDSPRGFLSQENNASDLVQVLELFNIISDLVKKNLKTLDLLPKFKNANSEEKNPAFSQKHLWIKFNLLLLNLPFIFLS